MSVWGDSFGLVVVKVCQFGKDALKFQSEILLGLVSHSIKFLLEFEHSFLFIELLIKISQFIQFFKSNFLWFHIMIENMV